MEESSKPRTRLGSELGASILRHVGCESPSDRRDDTAGQAQHKHANSLGVQVTTQSMGCEGQEEFAPSDKRNVEKGEEEGLRETEMRVQS